MILKEFNIIPNVTVANLYDEDDIVVESCVADQQTSSIVITLADCSEEEKDNLYKQLRGI